LTLASGAGKLNPKDEAFLYRVVGMVDITVYREFRPRNDDIEITVYFRLDDDETKYRLDFSEDRETLALIPGEADSWYMMGRLVQLVRIGNYREAANVVV
jgi:hypothetical protein